MPFSAMNFLMDRRKTKPQATEDELAVIKAAAWAWYERGSGSEGKPIREFDFTNSRRTDPTPSRYKIEAMKNTTIDENSSLRTSRNSTSISTCPSINSSLMDDYEIESISKDLDHYIEFCDHGSTRVGLGRDSAHHRRVVAVPKIEKGEVISSKVKSKKLSRGGFLLRHASVSCGSLNDAVAPRNTIVVGVRGRQPEKRATVVKSSPPPTGIPHAL